MVMSIISEYVVSNLIDKHRDKLPERIVNLIAEDTSFTTLLQKKILPNSFDALNENVDLLREDDDFTEQVIAPAIAFVIERSVLSGEMTDDTTLQTELDNLLEQDLTATQQRQLSDVVAQFMIYFRSELAKHQDAGDALIIQMISKLKNDTSQSLHKQHETLVGLGNKIDQLLSSKKTETQIGELQEIIGTHFSQILDEILMLWRQGKLGQARIKLQEVRENDIQWRHLEDVYKSRWFITEARLTLENHTNDIDTVKQLINQAKALDAKADYSYIDALVAFIERKYSEATTLIIEEYSEEALHLKSLVHFETGSIEKAKQILQTIDTPSIIHIFYTKARIALKQHNIHEAQSHLQDALNAYPNSPDMKFWLGQAKFIEVLSPAVQPDIFLQMPLPISPDLYRSTPKYKRILHEAIILFEGLSQSQSDVGIVSKYWYLACLILEQRIEEATILANEIISLDDPLLEVLLAWGTANDLGLDIEKIVSTLKKKIDGGSYDLNQIIALHQYYIHFQMYDEAQQLIESSQVFLKHAHQFAYQDFQLEIALVKNDFELAQELISQITDDKQRLKYELNIALSQNDEVKLQDLTSKDLSNQPILVFNLARPKMRLGEMEWVAQHAILLTEQINTNAAFDLAINASYGAQNLQLCLEIIDRIKLDYEGGELDWQYRNIEVRCLFELGRLRDAYPSIESLYRSNPNETTFISFVAICNHLGDLQHIALIARDLLTKNLDINDMEWFKTCEIVRSVDVELATDLWRRGIERELTNDGVLYGIQLAHTLGLKGETGNLFAKMTRIAQEGHSGVQMIQAMNAPQIFQEIHSLNQEFQSAYVKGEAPVHLLVERQGIQQFVWLYHHRLNLIEENDYLGEDATLLAFHGSRKLYSNIPLDVMKGNLAIDITSILLLNHLDILEMVANTYQPVRLPHILIPTLIEAMLAYDAEDRARSIACQNIIELCETKHIETISIENQNVESVDLQEQMGVKWTRIYEYAIENDAYMVNFTPVKVQGLSGKLANLPDDAIQTIIDVRSLVDVLRNKNVLTKTEYDTLVRQMGSLSQTIVIQPIELECKIIFYANTLEVLAEYGILRHIVKLFDVVIYEEQIVDARAVVNGNSKIREQINWLSRLIVHLRQGILAGIYEVLPIYQDDPVDKEDSIGISMMSIFSLLKQANKVNDIIIIDDRFGNQSMRSDNGHIFTSIDLLRHLTELNLLSPEELFFKLNQLRKSNIRYVLITSNEIIYHLLQAHESGNFEVHVGNQLDIILNYIKACLSQDKVLQIQPSETLPNQSSELGFLASTLESILNAIQILWQGSFSPATCHILGDWIIENLYKPNVSYWIKYEILNEDDAGTYSHFFQIAESLSFTPDYGGFSRQSRYKIWVNTVMVRQA